MVELSRRWARVYLRIDIICDSGPGFQPGWGSAASCWATAAVAEDLFGLKEGKAELQSAGPMAFGPNGILFVGDTKAATVYAIDTQDKSGEPAKRAAAIVKATTFYSDPSVIAEVSRGLGEAMVGINVADVPAPHRLAERGW